MLTSSLLTLTATFLIRCMGTTDIPSQPLTLVLESIGATSIQICWEAPLSSNTPITFYSIRAHKLNATDGSVIVIRNTTTNATTFNLTDLLPGTTYELTVVAVSQDSDIFAESQPSNPLIATTEFTVPAPICTVPVSSNGNITVIWSYIHTGGLSLTSVSVVYRFQEGLALSSPTNVKITNVMTMMVVVSKLVAGRLYTFTITADNSNGSASIECGPVRNDIGIPAAPTFGELRSGFEAGQVVIQIKTVASGVSDPATQGFEFVIVPVLDGTPGIRMSFPCPHYQSNMFKTITISDLVPGNSYIFSATAMNFFGESFPETSAPVQAAWIHQPTGVPPQTSGSSNVALVSGIFGALVVISIVASTSVVVVLLLYVRGKRKAASCQIEVPVYKETSRDNASPSYEKPQKDTDTQSLTKECPAYRNLQKD